MRSSTGARAGLTAFWESRVKPIVSVAPHFFSRHCRARASALGALASFGVSGCLGGQTGGEVEGPTPALGNDLSCDEVIRAIAFDEPSPLGESAADALAPVLRVSSSSLLWSANTAPVTLGPERGVSEIQISIEYQGGRVLWTDSEPKPAMSGAGGTGASGMGAGTALTALPACLDRLEVDVVASLATAGGALDESFPVTLRLDTAERVSLSHALLVADLSGSLSVSTSDGTSAPRLLVYAFWDEAGFHGSLDGEVATKRTIEQNPSSSSSSSALIQYAVWPPPAGTQP